MREIGRTDDALAWARRGIDTTTGWQVAMLFDLSAQLVGEQGNAVEVLAVRREHDERMASSSTYAARKAGADAVSAWPDEVGDARAVLAASDRGGLVDALLADGDGELAWDAVAAAAEPDWDAGEKRW